MVDDQRFSFVDVSLPQKKTLFLKPKVERYHTYIMNVIKFIVITLKSLTALIENFYIRRKFNQSRKYYIKQTIYNIRKNFSQVKKTLIEVIGDKLQTTILDDKIREKSGQPQLSTLRKSSRLLCIVLQMKTKS